MSPGVGRGGKSGESGGGAGLGWMRQDTVGWGGVRSGGVCGVATLRKRDGAGTGEPLGEG